MYCIFCAAINQGKILYSFRDGVTEVLEYLAQPYFCILLCVTVCVCVCMCNVCASGPTKEIVQY